MNLKYSLSPLLLFSVLITPLYSHAEDFKNDVEVAGLNGKVKYVVSYKLTKNVKSQLDSIVFNEYGNKILHVSNCGDFWKQEIDEDEPIINVNGSMYAREYEYDKQQRLVKLTYLGCDAVPTSRVIYEYDENGKLQKQVTTNASGRRSSTISYTYNSAGQLTAEMSSPTSGKQYIYNKNGNKTTIVNDNGVEIRREVIEYSLKKNQKYMVTSKFQMGELIEQDSCVLNQKGDTLLKVSNAIVHSRHKGKINRRIESQYNKNGKVFKTEVTEGSQKVETCTFTYDKQQNLIQKEILFWQKDNNGTKQMETWEYDSHGKPTKHTSGNWFETWEYDSYGNIRKHNYHNYKQYDEEYIIKYYD